MSPSAKKQFNTVIGGLFLGLGLVAWGVAVFFAVAPSDQTRLPNVVLAPSVDAKSCLSAVNQLYGFTGRIEGEKVVVTTPDLSEPHQVLKDATSAMAVCKRQLHEFCMGTGCAEQGMTMVLVQDENQKSVPKATEGSQTTTPAKAASAVKPTAKKTK